MSYDRNQITSIHLERYVVKDWMFAVRKASCFTSNVTFYLLWEEYLPRYGANPRPGFQFSAVYFLTWKAVLQDSILLYASISM